MEKIDGIINFGLWQVQVNDVLIQYGLHKTLKEKQGSDSFEGAKGSSKDSNKSSMSNEDEDWEDMDLRATSTIRLLMCMKFDGQGALGKA